MGVKLKLEGNSQAEIEYLQEVLSQAFPHWEFTIDTKGDNSSSTPARSSMELYFDSIDNIDNGILQQKRTVKKQHPDLIHEGVNTFGTEDYFFAWLVKPSFKWSGKTPVSLVISGKKEEVLQEMLRIQHGYIV